MRILALDLGKTTGFAHGEAGAIPTSGSVTLAKRSDPPEVAVRQLGCFLRDLFVFDKPDLICVEHYLHPEAQLSGDAVILQMKQHGAVDAIAGVYDLRVELPHAATVRKHFCGQARALPVSRGPKTSKQKHEAREATKQMVLKRAIALGYLPRGCIDDDRADACGIFDFAAATYARKTPERLVMFGEGAE